MRHRTLALGLLVGAVVGSAAVGAAFSILGLERLGSSGQAAKNVPEITFPATEFQPHPYFLLVAGGGAPSYNEIALEKNVLYFQRTMSLLGFEPASASFFSLTAMTGKQPCAISMNRERSDLSRLRFLIC